VEAAIAVLAEPRGLLDVASERADPAELPPVADLVQRRRLSRR
jgi:hypothetical protein